MKDLRQASRALFDTKRIIPGDAKERDTFFDHRLVDGVATDGAKLSMKANVRIPRYGHTDKDMRIPIVFPEKLRENMRALLGVESDEEYNVSTTALVLADYAARLLLDGEQTLVVSQAKSGLDTHQKD